MNNLPMTAKNEIADLLAANMKAVRSILPKHLTPERVMRIAYIAIEQSPKLGQCSKASLINAILEASMLGLEISTPLGHAHLVPYKTKCQLIIGYLGFLDLAYRSNQISKFAMQAVYEKDHFRYQYGTNAFIEHRPSDDINIGDLKYAYAIAQFKDGSTEFEVVNKRTAEATKARSAAKHKQDSPWNTSDEWTMWVKTAVRKLAKRLPMSPDIQRAAMLDEYAEAGIKQNISYIPDTDEGDLMPSASDLTKKIVNDKEQTPSDAQNSTISKKTYADTRKASKSQGEQLPTSRADLLIDINGYSDDQIDKAIHNCGWSETTIVDDLSFEKMKQLLDMLQTELF